MTGQLSIAEETLEILQWMKGTGEETHLLARLNLCIVISVSLVDLHSYEVTLTRVILLQNEADFSQKMSLNACKAGHIINDFFF